MIVVTLTEEQNILATVLFYKDSQGRVLLANGPVPRNTEVTIRKDVIARTTNATIKVVPIYDNETQIPMNKEIINHIKNKYPTVYVAPVPKRLSRSNMTDMAHYLVHRRIHTSDENNVNESAELSRNISIVLSGNGTGPVGANVTTLQWTSESEERVLSSPDDFLPNDVFYNIEKRCVNWADGCNYKNNGILNMSSGHLQFNFRPPYVLPWAP